MNEENRKISAERKEHQDAIKSFKIEIKSLNEKAEKYLNIMHEEILLFSSS